MPHLKSLTNQTLLPSPRNAIEGHLHLIKQTKCRHLVYSKGRDINLSQLRAKSPDMHFWEIPTLDEMLRHPVERFPYTKQFEDAENEVAFIIHSSGSTGKLWHDFARAGIALTGV